MAGEFTCETCEDQGLCDASLVKLVPYNCTAHLFKEQEPECNKDGTITKRRWKCERCGMPMSILQTGIHAGCIYYAGMA